MRPIVLIFAAVCCYSVAVSQPTHKATLSAWETIITDRDTRVLPADIAPKTLQYDLASLCLLHQSGRLGYIGKDFQRFYIYFSSISKDTVNARLYHVRGKTRVKENVCDFEGLMTLKAVRQVVDSPLGCGYKEQVKLQGIALFAYAFQEDPHQKAAGTFKGEAAISWYLDSLGQLRYDHFWDCADGFTNNVFVGIWKSYSTQGVKTCNWADGRVPNSYGLDFGAGEFSPNPKYKANGWDGGLQDTTAWWQ